MSKNQRGKAQRNPNFQPQHNPENQTQFSRQQNQFSNYGISQQQPSNSNYPSFQNQNPYYSQQNSNQYQNTQNSNYFQNCSFQQNPNYGSQFVSPNSQHGSMVPFQGRNVTRNLNQQFENFDGPNYENTCEVNEDGKEGAFENPDSFNIRGRNKQAPGININESPTDKSGEPLPKGPSQRRWSSDEQLELAYCWVKCSTDSKKGVSQSESSFWSSICNLFNRRQQNIPARTVDSLKTQWKRINRTCQRWNEIMVGLKSRRQNGANDFDLHNQANALFMVEHNNQPFTLQHCYDFLSQEPKWAQIDAEQTALRFQPRKMSDESSPGSAETHDNTTANSSRGKRPADKYKMKKQKGIDYTPQFEALVERMSSAETINKEYAEKRLEREREKKRRHAENRQLRLDDLALRKEELARQQRADDMALFSCNLNELSPMQRLYFEKQIEEYHKRQGGM